MKISLPTVRVLADSADPNSFANKLRSRRFRQFEALIAPLPRPLRILDVGGENAFWENRGWAGRRDATIFSLNVVAEKQQYENVIPITGDATDLSQFEDRSFDIAFSNSVIEHLFTFEKQQRMAAEIQRVGKAFWVQTPNFWFPIEPHFHMPAWQWMPVSLRVSIIRRYRCGWRGPCPDPIRARLVVEELRLLTKRELRRIFPGATLLAERFGGLVKSWTVVRGFPAAEVREFPTTAHKPTQSTGTDN